MSDIHTDLVVQISASAPEADAPSATVENVQDSRLIPELRRCLQPGVEIALVFEGYMAITSILWLSELQPDGSVRAGVRLLGVSALPNERSEPTLGTNAPHRAAPAYLGAALYQQR